MLIERTDDGRGPFDGLTGKYTIYYTTRKHYILYEKCNDFAPCSTPVTPYINRLPPKLRRPVTARLANSCKVLFT
jgi:hypothetical protein